MGQWLCRFPPWRSTSRAETRSRATVRRVLLCLQSTAILYPQKVSYVLLLQVILDITSYQISRVAADVSYFEFTIHRRFIKQ
jgi:hypothetical protein